MGYMHGGTMAYPSELAGQVAQFHWLHFAMSPSGNEVGHVLPPSF
jgi:hypothetical protein